MTNEAVIVELLGDPKGKPISFTCADGVGIEKGTILWFYDNRTCSGASVTGSPFAGIASTEKVANDGSTHIGCWTCGIFDLTVNSSVGVTIGAYVSLSGANLIKNATEAEIAAGGAIGKSLETGSASEVIQVAVGLY